MSTSIDQAFVKQYEREVHEAYQRQGSKLRNTVRTVSNVKGTSTTFQIVGKGSAGTKTRHGLVPVMNLVHSNVECVLADYYAGEWVDKLDELKINHDERAVITSAEARALGRKTDELIINALDEVVTGSTGQVIADGNTGISMTKIYQAFETHGQNDIFEEGEMFAAVGWKQWTELLDIDEFANADYVGGEDLPFKQTPGQMKYWLGTYWMPHSGLPVDANDIRKCYWWNKKSIGHASGADVMTDVTWHGDRAAHFVSSMMSQGAKLIDGLGVIEIQCDETPD